MKNGYLFGVIDLECLVDEFMDQYEKQKSKVTQFPNGHRFWITTCDI